jgi:CopG family nickel-responsive transcriptional regulator
MMLIRFGISEESNLHKKFDYLIAQKGYANRSEAMRALIRDSLDQAQRGAGFEETLRGMTVVYSQQTRDFSGVFGHLQHGDYRSIISSTYIPTDEHNCPEGLNLPALSLQGVNVSPDKVYNFR